MQVKSAAWWAALQASSVEWQYGVDILASDEATLLENILLYDENANDRLVPQSSQVDLDTSAATHRTFQLNLRNSDGRYLIGPAGLPSGGVGSPIANGLVWYNVRYRPWIKLRTGFTASGSKVWDTTYLGMFVLSNPDTQVKTVGSQMQLNLLDKAALLQKPYIITDATLPTYPSGGGTTVGGYAGGTSFNTAMSDLATRAGVPAGKQLFAPSTLTLPGDFSITEGTEWWTALTDLAASLSYVLYFDWAGNLVCQTNPLLVNAPSLYTFAPGPWSIMSSVERKNDFSSTFNHVIAIGGSTTTGTFRGEAQVNDPTSPYHKNEIGDRIVYVGKDGKLGDMTPDPNIGSTGQATTRAQVVLAQGIGQQEEIVVQGRNIPAIEPFDRVTVNSPLAGVALDFQVTKVTWKLDHSSGGGMTLDLSRWYVAGS